MNKIHRYLYWPFCFFLLLSCRDKKQELDFGYNYFPLTEGDYRIYDVNMSTYSSSDTLTENFQIKELVSEKYTINGEERYRIERYQRNSPSDSWPPMPDSVWSAIVTSSRAVRIENNTRFVKLVFPVENGKQWNGNVENNYGEESYQMRDAGKSFTVLSTTYPKTVSVLHNFDTSYVQRDYREEVFAENVGLIRKIREQYKYSQDPQDWLLHKIVSGIKYEENLSSYGHQ